MTESPTSGIPGNDGSAREAAFLDPGARAQSEPAERERLIAVRALAISARFWQVAAAVLLVAHVWLVVQLEDPTMLSRCGALWVIVGGALVARPVVRKGYAKWDRGSVVIVERAPTTEEVEERRQADLDAVSVQFWGPVFAVVGTLIWGYGDLLAAAALARW